MNRMVCSLSCLLLCVGAANAQAPSRCVGSTGDGALENGWKLPLGGLNFEAYSTTGWLLGRTYVHSQVFEVVLAAYARLSREASDKTFVYGETGKRQGGEFRPHKTHRNGLSVDFMVPLVDAKGRSVAMRTSPFNRWGYDLEFDQAGKLNDLTIDAEAMAEHIYHLHRAAENAGIGIWRVIFDPKLQPLLHSTRRWEYLSEHVQFSTQRSWVRHDDHYHVDFELPCE